MKIRVFLLLTLFIGFSVYGQDKKAETISGRVLNAADDQPMSDVNIVNLTQVTGATTDREGHFRIKAQVNDTLYFTYLGFKAIQIKITEDWVKYGDVKIKMTEVGFALDPVVLKPIQLTGFLEIDAKNIPIYDNYRYQIAGSNSGYEAGSDQPGGFSRTLSSIFNPIDYLHNVFGKKPKQMRKLRQMKKNDEIQHLLETKFDRETLSALLGVQKKEINKILQHCNYSKTFIKEANDLQILDAISDCYENYKALNRK